MKIRHRHFRRGNQPELVPLREVGLLGKLRELARPGHGLGRHQVGNPKLLIGVARGVQVQHVIHKPPLKPRPLPLQQGKP